MRAIFVDADGCLIDDGWADKQMIEEGYDPYDLDEFNPRSLKLLARLASECNAKVIFSSDWRRDEIAFKHAKEQFNSVGIELYDTTGIKASNHEIEIKFYLLKHREITNYVILDDWPMTAFNFIPHYVQTTIKDGFTFKMFEQAKKILLKGE